MTDTPLTVELYERVKRERDEVQAAYAEMRKAIEFCNCNYLGGEHHQVCQSQRARLLEHALSSDCGKDLLAELECLRWDIDAYRAALGYSVPGNHTGKLSDGSMPQCGLCNSAYRKEQEAELKRKTKALEYYRDNLGPIMSKIARDALKK